MSDLFEGMTTNEPAAVEEPAAEVTEAPVDIAAGLSGDNNTIEAVPGEISADNSMVDGMSTLSVAGSAVPPSTNDIDFTEPAPAPAGDFMAAPADAGLDFTSGSGSNTGAMDFGGADATAGGGMDFTQPQQDFTQPQQDFASGQNGQDMFGSGGDMNGANGTNGVGGPHGAVVQEFAATDAQYTAKWHEWNERNQREMADKAAKSEADKAAAQQQATDDLAQFYKELEDRRTRKASDNRMMQQQFVETNEANMQSGGNIWERVMYFVDIQHRDADCKDIARHREVLLSLKGNPYYPKEA